jgi:hypothetical protein
VPAPLKRAASASMSLGIHSTSSVPPPPVNGFRRDTHRVQPSGRRGIRAGRRRRIRSAGIRWWSWISRPARPVSGPGVLLTGLGRIAVAGLADIEGLAGVRDVYTSAPARRAIFRR